MVELNLTKQDCKNLADMVDIYFIQNIRESEDLDNIDYIRSMLKGLDELKRVSK